MRGPLPSWREGAALRAILDFVVDTTMPTSPSYIRIEDRIAVVDNDGTMWCEKPLPIRAQFLARPPAGASVEELAAAAETFLRSAHHPVLHRSYLECTYRPMTALVRFLHANRFTTYLAAGAGRDFVRTMSEELYGIPSDRVIGSSTELEFVDDLGAIVQRRSPDFRDDGPAKPIQIWSRVGRRPVLVVGNSNGDVPMLRYAAHPSRRSLGVLVDHDDDTRDFAYRGGAEEALRLAPAQGWIVVSVARDWAEVMAGSGNGNGG